MKSSPNWSIFSMPIEFLSTIEYRLSVLVFCFLIFVLACQPLDLFFALLKLVWFSCFVSWLTNKIYFFFFCSSLRSRNWTTRQRLFFFFESGKFCPFARFSLAGSCSFERIKAIRRNLWDNLLGKQFFLSYLLFRFLLFLPFFAFIFAVIYKTFF